MQRAVRCVEFARTFFRPRQTGPPSPIEMKTNVVSSLRTRKVRSVQVFRLSDCGRTSKIPPGDSNLCLVTSNRRAKTKIITPSPVGFTPPTNANELRFFITSDWFDCFVGSQFARHRFLECSFRIPGMRDPNLRNFDLELLLAVPADKDENR